MKMQFNGYVFKVDRDGTYQVQNGDYYSSGKVRVSNGQVFVSDDYLGLEAPINGPSAEDLKKYLEEQRRK